MDMIDPPSRRRRFAAGRMLWPGLIALLAASVGIGIAVGRFSTATIVPLDQPSAYREGNTAFRPDPIATDAGTFALAEAERGRNWAAQAFPSGLRDCPDPTPAFQQGCAAAMTNLAGTAAQDASDSSAASGDRDPADQAEASDAYRPPALPARHAPVIVTPDPRGLPASRTAGNDGNDPMANAGPHGDPDRAPGRRSYDSDASADEGNVDH